MTTEKLYYQDSEIKTFDANIIDCIPLNNGYGIVLDRTAFYPEGGGQPGDTGLIGDTPVTDCHEKDGQILHYTDAPLAPGQAVHCQIDWARRFSFMQGHTGEHIVSGLIQKMYGLDNVGFHMGSAAITIDLNGMLNENQLAEVEAAANKAVYENLPIRTTFKEGDALAALAYRSKIPLSGPVRIVDIPCYDTCACSGTHLKTTGEVGIIKFLSHQKYKSGIRIYLLCGFEALLDYRQKNTAVGRISALLSAKQTEVVDAVVSLLEQNTALKHSLGQVKNQLFSAAAAQAPANTAGVCVFYPGLTPDELRRLCTALLAKTGVALALSGDDESGYKYALGVEEPPIKPLLTELNQRLNGKGGGKGSLVQGSFAATAAAIRALAEEKGFALMDF